MDINRWRLTTDIETHQQEYKMWDMWVEVYSVTTTLRRARYVDSLTGWRAGTRTRFTQL